MSKIICDVCGTSYPEAATQCPICGCVRSADAKLVAGDTDTTVSAKNGTYTYVKGGRFSKANVRKRSTPAPSGPSAAPIDPEKKPEGKQKSDKGLVLAVVLLLLAIIAVVIYIAVRFFGPGPADDQEDTQKEPDQSVSDTQKDENEQDDQTPVEVPCDSLTVSDVVVTFEEVGQTLQLTVTAEPADTTDTVEYASDDTAVASVNDDGLITAVGPGETIIRVKCGEEEVQCSVTCTIEDTSSTQGDDTQDADPNVELTLNREDFSLFYKGEQWNLYNGTIPVENIQWSTSDEDVATVSNGVVTAVGNTFNGDYATITAEYNGTKVTCIVRWTPRESGLPGNGGVSEA